MRRTFLLLAVLGLVGVFAVSGGSAATPAAVAWGGAIKVPGTATLNSGGNAIAFSVSCAAAGDCAAGGHYADGSGDEQAYVADETGGSWGTAVEVPGTATLNTGGSALVESVSCAAPGDCAVGGYYYNASDFGEAFVVSETNGGWDSAVEVPGTAALNTGGNAHTLSVSCGAVGDCAAGGYYTDGSGDAQAFVVNETNGSWGTAVEVPGAAGLNTGGYAEVNSISCASAGDCTAGGYYTSVDGHAFVVSETNGSWGTAVEVPGTETLNSGNGSEVNSVSCAAAGDCAAEGAYYVLGSGFQAFVISETNGSWGTAVEVPGTATLNSGGNADEGGSISCAAVGDCAADGSYIDGSGHKQAFVASETNGSWGTAIEVPGTATLNSGGEAGVNSISCAAAGDCAAGGLYKDGSSHFQAFVISETNGSWGDAVEVPGTATLNSGGNADVYAVSCGAAGECAAGGYYTAALSHDQAFVVNSALRCVVPKVVGKTLSAAKKTLKAAHCGVGKIKRVYSKVRNGRVAAQNPKPGKHLASGAKVALTVNKGKRK